MWRATLRYIDPKHVRSQLPEVDCTALVALLGWTPPQKSLKLLRGGSHPCGDECVRPGPSSGLIDPLASRMRKHEVQLENWDI